MGHYAAEMNYNEELSSEELKIIYQEHERMKAEMFSSDWCKCLDLSSKIKKVVSIVDPQESTL